MYWRLPRVVTVGSGRAAHGQACGIGNDIAAACPGQLYGERTAGGQEGPQAQPAGPHVRVQAGSVLLVDVHGRKQRAAGGAVVNGIGRVLVVFVEFCTQVTKISYSVSVRRLLKVHVAELDVPLAAILWPPTPAL